MSTNENDILAGGLVAIPNATDDDDPIARVHRVAQRARIAPEIADDWLKVTGGIESGNRQYNASGGVLTGPPTKQTGARALGFGQVMPDAKGGTVRTIHGRQYDLTDPEQNIEAGLHLFAAGGADPVARRLEYFGGRGARRQYEQTGQIPAGGDGYTSYQQYVAQTMGPPQRRTQKQPEPDILAGGLVTGPEAQAPVPATGPLAEMDAVARQARGPEAKTAPTHPQTQPAPTSQQPAPSEQPTPRTLTGRDVLWHFGPIDNAKLTRRQLRVLTQAVEEDERKRAAGETITPPDLSYQNEMRRRAGLPPLQYNLQRERTMQIGSITLRVPDEARQIAPVYRPEDLGGGELPQLNVPAIRTRDNQFHFEATPQEQAENRARTELRRRLETNPATFTGEEYENYLRLNRSLDTPRMREDYLNHKVSQETALKGGGNLWGGGSATNVLVAENVERDRQRRVAKMLETWGGTAQYAAQAPKSLVLGASDSAATFLKSIAVAAKKLDDWTGGRDYEGKETTDLATYQAGEAIQKGMRDLLGSDPDLEQEFLVGQSPQAIGQVFSFMLGGWATKAPKLTTVILGAGMTTGDAYDEVRAAGGSDADAVNAALVAGGLLGPTELFGMKGAMHAIESRAVKATWRAALKEALKEGRRDMVENVLQEMGQEWGQGEITGKRRTGKEVLMAGAQGAFGAVVTVPATLIANRPQRAAQPLAEVPDVTVKPAETPIALTEDRPITFETPATIAAQIDAMVNQRGNRMGVLIPKGQSAPTKIPKGHVATRTSEGVVIHPKELSSSDVRELVKDGNTWQLLGHANPDGPEATRVVIARSSRDAENGIRTGDELMASYVVPGQEQNAIDEMRAQFGPYAPTFEVGGAETAAAAVEERAAKLQPGWRPGMPRPSQKAEPGVTPEGQPAIPAVRPGYTRFYRADAPDATGPQGGNWSTEPEYVSQKYGAGQMQGGETLWYRDVPTQALNEEYGDAMGVSMSDTDALDRMGASMPKLYRQTQPTPPPAAKPSRFEGLSNEQLESYIANTRSQMERRLAKAAEPLPKGTSKARRQALPGIIERQRQRSHERITEAQVELDQRRAGRGEIPSFEQWLETEAGGTVGGVRAETLSSEERASLQKQYDARFYPKPHHSTLQNRRKTGPRKGQFAPGKVAVSTTVETTETSPIGETTPAPVVTGPQEAAPEGQLFATEKVTAREPTADEQAALREPPIEVKPMEKQNALRSYLGNKMTMARARAFDIVPQSWRDKWTRVVDVFGGSGIHGWQIGKALAKPIHYNELDPDVFSFQSLARSSEGQEEIRRVWNPMLDEIARIRQQHPEGGSEAHRQVSAWWNDTAKRLRRPDATPPEKAARVLLENSLGTMGGTQSLIGADHKWKKDIGSLGEVSALLDKHRLNAQMWQSTSNERAEDLLPKTKPGDLVVLDPPYASTKGYAVGNEHGSVNGAVQFIEKSIKPAVDRGVSILYTNSAHLPIVEALRHAGLEARIERVQTQTRAGQQGAFRYEVTAWTPDVSPPRPSDPDVLRGLIEQDTTAGQRDLTGQTGEELWNTLIRAAQASEVGPAHSVVPPQRSQIEQTRRNLTVERDRLATEAAKILAKEQHYSIKGDPIPTESVLQREVDRANALRLEMLLKINDDEARNALGAEFPEHTITSVTAAAGTAPIEKPSATAEEPDTEYRPMEGDLVEWTSDDGKTLNGKVLRILPSGSVRVRVAGRNVTERKLRLPATTQFKPYAKEVKAPTHVVGRPKLNPAVDSLEKAIRALGGIEDTGTGEIIALREAGKAGLVTKDGRSAEDMAMALAEMGYGRGVWWEGSLRQGDSSFTGVNADQFIQAATDDATGSERHYSSEYEQDFTAEEEAYWREQMEAHEAAQFDSSKEVIESELGSELLGEIADGQATNQTYSQLRDFADEVGLEPAVTDELINLAESESPESAAARDRALSGETDQTDESAGRPLGTYVDEDGTLRDESGGPLFRRRLPAPRRPTRMDRAGELMAATYTQDAEAEDFAHFRTVRVTERPNATYYLLENTDENRYDEGHYTVVREDKKTGELMRVYGDDFDGQQYVMVTDEELPAEILEIEPEGEVAQEFLGLIKRDFDGIEGMREALQIPPASDEPLFRRRELDLGQREPQIRARLNEIDAELAKAAPNGKKAERLLAEKKELTTELGTLAVNAKPKQAPPPEPRFIGDTFFSQLYRTIDAKMPKRASAEQIEKIIQSPQNGVKQDEVRWTGLDDWLTEQPKDQPITKAALLEFLRDNALDIREQIKSPDANADYRDEQLGLPDLTQGQMNTGWQHSAVEPEEGEEVDQDTQEFVFSHNAVPIEFSGSNDAGWRIYWTKEANVPEDEREIGTADSVTDAKVEAYTAYRDAFETEREQFGDMDSQYDQYVLPGPALNYQEQVFIAPLEPKLNAGRRWERRQALSQESNALSIEMRRLERKYGISDQFERNTADAINAAGDGSMEAKADGEAYQIAFERQREVSRMLRKIPTMHPRFQSGHWNEENVIAHSRTTDRRDSEGKSGLLIEEVQSDLHQQAHDTVKTYREDLAAKYNVDPDKVESVASAREKQLLAQRGYSDSTFAEELNNRGFDIHAEQMRLMERNRADTADISDEEHNRNAERLKELDQELRDLEAERNQANAGPPPAPLARNWHEFVLRRLIRQAAEHGDDRIYWTTGKQQINRWQEALRQNVKAIRWYKTKSTGVAVIQAIPFDEAKVQDTIHVPLRGRTNVHGRQVSLDDVVGKKLAKEIREAPATSETHIVEGDNLTLGGDGMTQFYDQMIPSFMRRFGAKFGAKVGQVSLKGDNLPKDLVATADGDQWVITSTSDRNYKMTVTRSSGNTAEEVIDKLRKFNAFTVHYMDITPQMIESVMGGQPLFKRRLEALRDEGYIPVMRRQDTRGEPRSRGDLFFGPYEISEYGPQFAGYADYGPNLSVRVIDKSARIFDGASSYDYIDSRGLADTPDPIVQRITKGRLSTLNEVVDAEGDINNPQPGIQYEVAQTMASRELKKEGYDGAHWKYEDDLSPEQWQIWNRDVLKRVGELMRQGKPQYARGNRIAGTEGIIRDGSSITIDTATRDALERAEILPPGADGVTVRPALAVIYANRLTEAAKQNAEDAPVLRRVARLMQAAANVEGAGSVIVATSEALRHEQFHQASDVPQQPLASRHGRFDELTAHASFKTARAKLIAAGYEENDAVLVEETAAHIAEGEHRAIGLTPKQATDWMQLWFESFEAKNGSISLRHFREMANEAQAALAAAINKATAEGTSQRAHQDVRSIQEGRPSRAGPTAALAKGPTADIETEPRFLGGVFHSQLYRTMVQKMPGTASVEQVRKIVENPQSGIKAEEVKWSGLDDFLADKATVRRKEILDFLRANALQITEKRLGTKSDDLISEQMEKEAYNDPLLGAEIRALTDWGLVFTVDPGDPTHVAFMYEDPDGDYDGEILSLDEIPDALAGPNNRGARAQRAARALSDHYDLWLKERHGEYAAKYGRYTVPGDAANYREIVFTLPKREEAVAGNQNYETTHWKGMPNPVAHTRLDERTTTNGKTVLFINEVQSDWHQRARRTREKEIQRLMSPETRSAAEKRKYGTAPLDKKAAGALVPEDYGYKKQRYDWHVRVYSEALKKEMDLAVNFPSQQEAQDWIDGPDGQHFARIYKNTGHALTIQRGQERIGDGDRVPPAPFQKNWHEFVMRRMLAEAVAGGYEHLGWLTGDQANELYDLSRDVESISYRATGEGEHAILIHPKQGSFIDLMVNSQTGIIRSATTLTALKDKPLDEAIGKDLATKILSDDSQERVELKGLDLKVGGQGMRGFYDKIIPDYMRRLVKKWGGKVEEINIGPAPPKTAEDIAREVALANVHNAVGADIMLGMLDKGTPVADAISQTRDSLLTWEEYDRQQFETVVIAIKEATAAEQKRTDRSVPLDRNLAQQTLERIMNRADIAGPSQDDLQMAAGRVLGAINGEAPAASPVSVEEALRREEQYGDAEMVGQIRSELAMAQGRQPATRKIHAVKITPEMRESLLADSQPLFKRKPKEGDREYEKRTSSALDRLQRLARQRGQQVREAPRAAPAPTTSTTAPTPAATNIPAPTRRSAASTSEGRTAERSFPKTAEAAGYRGGTDRDYSILTNDEALRRAEARILQLGPGEAAAELARNDNPGAEENATAILLMQRFERIGQVGRAVAVATDLAKKLTRAGQFVQATSIITRLSPEGVLLTAQQRLKPGRTLSEQTAQHLVDTVKTVSEAERMVAEIQRQRPDIFGPNGEILPRVTATETRRDSGTRVTTQKGTRAKIGKLQDRLAKMEQDARARIEARKNTGGTVLSAGGLGSTKVAADLGDLVIIGAAKIARKGMTTAVWMAEMAKEASALTRKDLRRLYRESYEVYERERKQFLNESRQRGAQREADREGRGPIPPGEMQAVINARLDAQTRARKARAELQRTFQDLNATRTVKVGRAIRDVWGLSRALITSVDLSAGGRQGKMGLVTHPKAWMQGFARQFRAFSTTQYERMVSEMQLDPDYKYTARFGLELTSIGRAETGAIGAHEEAYQTELADKLPWLRLSQQAYDTMLDTLRFGWFKANLEKARLAGINLEDPDLKEQLTKDTSLINKFTGRGGGRRTKEIAKYSNVFLFSTRFWASRLEVMAMPLNPRMWGIGPNAYSRQARVDAWKTLFGFYGLVTTQLMIAKALGAAFSFDPDDDDFILNPDSADFLKARFGDVHIDFSAGMQSNLRVAARLARVFYMREFEKEKPRQGPADIIGKYLRGKEEPNIALLHDLFFSDKKDTPYGPRGTDYAGNPVFLLGEPGKPLLTRIAGSAIASRIIPIVLRDALEGYKQGTGLKEVGIAWAASTLGEGANTYKKRYSERAEKFPMQTELDRLKITINPPQRIKPGKYDAFKTETEEEYDARRRAEAEAIKVALGRLEGMNFYQKLPDEQREAAIRATIKAARESVRYQQPAKQRQVQDRATP